jgi:Trp operon repressor
MSTTDTVMNDALFGAAREVGSADTPSGLARRGIRRLRFVPKEKMAELLERAVEKIVAERLAKQEAVTELVDEVQSGAAALVRGVQEVEAARSDIAGHRHTLQDELAAILRERGRLPQLDERPSDTESDIQRATRERDLAIDRLERRVAKLIATLEATELALQRALKTQSLDTGIASLHRAVHGLTESDPRAEQKRELMREIFRANVELYSAFERNRMSMRDARSSATELAEVALTS